MQPDFDNLAEGERNFPVAFTRNTIPSVSAIVNPVPEFAGQTITIKVTSPKALNGRRRSPVWPLMVR